jgi:lipopolysaccharide/colanic/teichoic acid biosynthesis glycosyltransferase
LPQIDYGFDRKNLRVCGAETLRKHLLVVIDLCCMALATVFALILRDNLEVSLDRIYGLLPYLALTLAVAVPASILSGLNRSIWRLSVMADYLRVPAAVVMTVFGAVALGFAVNRLEGVARSLPVLQGVLMVCAMVGIRVFARLRHSARNRAPLQSPNSEARRPREHVVVIGLNRITELYLRSVAEFSADHVKIVGILEAGDRHSGRFVHRVSVLGRPDDVSTILRNLEVHGVPVDRIGLTLPFHRLSKSAQEALLELEKSSNVELDLFAERNRFVVGSRDEAASSEMVFSFATSELEKLSLRPFWRLKRTVDVVVSASLILLLMPAIAFVAVLVIIDVGLPLTFWQQRPGLGGWPFRLYKFRTMRVAHTSNGVRLPEAARISAIGWFLRRTRLDELPQLFNILMGEMSFVGPRPLLPVDQPPAFAARLTARPGLTGWAQIKGGRDISAADKAALDVWYIQNASLLLDLKILVYTIPMLLFGERVDQKAIRLAWSELRDRGICSEPLARSEKPRSWGCNPVAGASIGMPITESTHSAEISALKTLVSAKREQSTSDSTSPLTVRH